MEIHKARSVGPSQFQRFHDFSALVARAAMKGLSLTTHAL